MFLTICPDDSALRRSTRHTKGEGGTAVQLERVGEAVKHVPREKKRAVADIPDTNFVNPMAPVVQPRRRSQKKKGDSTNMSTPAPGARAASPAPQFLVPPGTEPSLTVPTLGFYAYGHEYGLPENLRQTVKPDIVPQQARASTSKLGRSQSTATLVIDPSLFNSDEPSGLRNRVNSNKESTEESTEKSAEESSEESGDEDGDEDGDGDSDSEVKDNVEAGADHNTIEGRDAVGGTDYNGFEDGLNYGLQNPDSVGFGSNGDRDSAADGKSYIR